MATQLTITVSRFLEYYYEQGSDQEIEQLKLELAEQVIEGFYNTGQCCILVQDIFDKCDKNAIHVNYIEEFSNDIYNELSDVMTDFELKLIP
jgi:hypothetical protein